MNPEENKERLLKFLYDLFRMVENNEITNASFEISRGIIEDYDGIKPSPENHVVIDFTANKKVIR